MSKHQKPTPLNTVLQLDRAESYAAAQAVVDAALACNPELNSQAVTKYDRAVMIQRLLRDPLLTKALFSSSQD